MDASGRWAIYLRKSRADIELEKIGQGETLKKHREILSDLAKKRGIIIGNVYEELVSGETIANRPEMQKLINDCYSGLYAGIVVIDVDRLSRGNQGDMQTIMDCLRYGNGNKGLLVMTPSKTYDVSHNPDDEEYMEFVLFMSRREYKTITKRMQRGKLQSVVEGNYIASKRPYGWDIVDTRYYRTIEPNEAESKWVKYIYEEAAKGTPYKAIARDLTMMGVPTYTNEHEWSCTSVKGIVKNVVNKGYVSWNNKKTVKRMEGGELVSHLTSDTADSYMEYKGKHFDKAYISEELWNRANKRIKLSKTKDVYDLKNKLAGLLVCKKCGRTMMYRMPDKGSSRSTRYKHQLIAGCTGVRSCLSSVIMSGLCDALKANIYNFEMLISSGADKPDHSSEIEQMRSEMEKLEKRIEKLFDGWEDGKITDDDFVRRKKANEDKIEILKGQIIRRQESTVSAETIRDKIVTLHEAIDYIQDDSATAADVNAFLKQIIEKIEYSCETAGDAVLEVYLK